MSLSDVLWGLFAAVLTAALLAWIGWSLKTFLKVNVVDPLLELKTMIDTIWHLVHYHLGPNGETKALHRRVSDIEKANGIEDT